ncbi:heme exporter protein CcmD [Candidatus Pelagibacter sp.]|nr:heme exporter protein CcmD [Candidatus Pelagibacter sp.]
MIAEIINMNGYGIYVWSSFGFTILSFLSLYLVVKNQHIREKNKFIVKFGNLNSERAASAKLQKINREILSNTSTI